MAIYSYRLARGGTRWMFIIDLPPAGDGRRRQLKRKGFRSQEAALDAERDARAAYGGADCRPMAALPASWRTGWSSASSTWNRPRSATTATSSATSGPTSAPGRHTASTSGPSTICTPHCSSAAANAAARSPGTPCAPSTGC